MALDVLHAEFAGGGPGFVLVRISGRAHADRACRLAPPTLLVGDGPAFARLPAAPSSSAIVAGPDAPPFTVEIPMPLHLAEAAGGWWLEPGAPLPEDDRVAALTARIAELERRVTAERERERQIADLRDRIGALGDELAALRARVEQAQPRPAPVPRPLLRRLRPTLPAIMIATGALAVGDAVATVVWQEPISGLYAMRQQSVLSNDLDKLDQTLARAQPALPVRTPPQVRMRALARTLATHTKAGKPLARLTIPRIDASYVVVQGTGAGSLRRGPGHYGGTALPGEAGTVGIAGHRTTYGAPFRHLDALHRGDTIDVRMPYGSFRYRVEGTRIVKPADVSVLQSAGRQRLALTACHPLYSAAQRIVVLARLERATPRGAAAATPAAAPPAGGDAAPRSPRA